MTHLNPEQLGAYADGELSPVERRAAADHLQACGGCRTELHLLEQLSRGFGRAAIEPSAGFEARSLERLRALPMPRRAGAGGFSGGVMRAPALGFATLLVVAMGAWAVHEHRTGGGLRQEAALAAEAQPEEIAVASQADFLEQIDLLEDLDLVEALDEAKAG